MVLREAIASAKVSRKAGRGRHRLGALFVCTEALAHAILRYERMIASMMLAGISVPDALVRELARMLREAELPLTAETLENAYDAERRIVALTVTDRESILRALEDCPDELAELRGVLVRELEWRMREGLV